MLLGASPLGAIVIAFFEYVFYWCIILTLAKFMEWVQREPWLVLKGDNQ
jgi:hypothetical protein